MKHRGHHGHHGQHRGRGFGFMEDKINEKLGRVLGHGDLKFVILHLLNEKPRHGYEMIKLLEELSKGAYSPSPGVIYPTLSYLEDSSFAVVSTESAKKLYTITEEGKIHLQENQETVDEIIFRMEKIGEKISKLKKWMGREDSEEISKEDKSPIRKAMHGLKAELYYFIDKGTDEKKKIAKIIESATEEIKKLRE